MTKDEFAHYNGTAQAIRRFIDRAQSTGNLTPAMAQTIIRLCGTQGDTLRHFDAYARFYSEQNAAWLIYGGNLDAIRRQYATTL